MKRTFSLLFLPILFLACNSQPNLEAEKQALQSILQTEQNAHLSKNPQMLVDLFADDFITVSQGVINQPTREESLARFAQYFNTVEFEKWEDVSPPQFNFSKDGTMCWVTVDKEVILTFETDEGDTFRQSVRYAWVGIYEKVQGSWQLTANVSTNKPPTKEQVTTP